MKTIKEYVFDKTISSIDEYVSHSETISLIKEYLLSNKNKSYVGNDLRDYCLAVIFDEIPEKYEKMLDDAKVINKANYDIPCYWLLPLDTAIDLDEELGGILLYQIPEFCHTAEEVKEAGLKCELDVEDLEMIGVYQ